MKFTQALAANCNFTIVFNFDASHATYINSVLSVLNSSEIERIIGANITNLSLYLCKIIVYLWKC